MGKFEISPAEEDELCPDHKKTMLDHREVMQHGFVLDIEEMPSRTGIVAKCAGRAVP
jgi:hypothetical protein